MEDQIDEEYYQSDINIQNEKQFKEFLDKNTKKNKKVKTSSTHLTYKSQNRFEVLNHIYDKEGHYKGCPEQYKTKIVKKE